MFKSFLVEGLWRADESAVPIYTEYGERDFTSFMEEYQIALRRTSRATRGPTRRRHLSLHQSRVQIAGRSGPLEEALASERTIFLATRMDASIMSRRHQDYSVGTIAALQAQLTGKRPDQRVGGDASARRPSGGSRYAGLPPRCGVPPSSRNGPRLEELVQRIATTREASELPPKTKRTRANPLRIKTVASGRRDPSLRISVEDKQGLLEILDRQVFQKARRTAEVESG